MNPYEELSELIGEAADAWLMSGHRVKGSTPEGESAKAVIAAGYGKPRTITTVAELDALPLGAVLLSKDSHPWQIEDDEDGERWYVANADTYFTSEIFTKLQGPFTVIWEPAA